MTSELFKVKREKVLQPGSRTRRGVRVSAIAKSSRARGSNRGGTGGGYEQTSPDYESNRLRQLRETHDSLDPQYRKVFLAGLSRWEQKFVKDRRMEVPQG